MATESTGAVTETAVGMPQLDVTTWPNQIFWLLVALVAIYLILTRVALPRIGGVLAERQSIITNDLAAAENLRQQAVRAESAYNEALVQARAEAGRIVASAKSAIQADLQKAAAEADAEIAARAAESETRIAEIGAGARADVMEVATQTAAELVQRFGGRGEDVAAAVAARMQG